MNLFDMPRFPLHEEHITILENNKNIRIERIVSAGNVTDWYDQDETEFVALLQGEAQLEFEHKKIVNLKKGDTITILPHERHRVSYTSKNPACVWLCIFWV